MNSEVRALHGDKMLEAIDRFDRRSATVRRVDSGGVFVFIGADAETDWMPDAILINSAPSRSLIACVGLIMRTSASGR